MKRCAHAGVVLLVLWGVSHTTQLENWRFPYYNAAARMGRCESSPSGMFWDDLGCRPSWGEQLWPDSSKASVNHWHFEPSYAASFSNVEFIDGKKLFWHLDALNEIRFRRLLLRQTLDVDSRYSDDSTYFWKTDRGAAGRIEEAYAQLDWNWGMFRFGRLKRNWGPFADRSLLLSANPHTYDALEVQFHSSLFEFRHIFGAFPFSNSNIDSDKDQKTNRYLTAHSLNLMLGKWVTVGVTETVLFPRASGFPDLQYVNPFSIYTVTNTNQEGSGNLMLGFQWKIHPFTEKIALLGQVNFDDFQVDNEKKGDQEPTHWGGDFGVRWTNPFPADLPHEIHADYTRMSRWIYTVNNGGADQGERYLFLERSLGYPFNDGDRLEVAGTVAGSNHWLASIGVVSTRKGPNGLLTRWSEHPAYYDPARGDSVSLGYRSEPSFSDRDSIEHSIDLFVEGRGYFRDYIEAAVRITNRWVRNKGNIPTQRYSFDPRIEFALSVHYSDFYVKLPE